MYKIFLSFTLMMICNVLAIAQDDIEVNLSAPSKVETGKPFRVELSVNSQKATMHDPKLDDFQVYGKSQSSNMSIINGDVTVKRSYIYTCVAENVGTFTIPGAQVELGGKTYTSNSVIIKVEQGNSQPATGNSNNNSNNSNNPISNDPNITPSETGDLFVDVSCNKNEVYLGEQLIISATIFSRFNIVAFDDVTFPNFSGFWTKDIHNPQNIQFDRKRINNKAYLYALMHKKALFPQKVGTLTIDPYAINCIITDGYGFRQQRAIAKSKAKTIKVKPLPDNKPDGFGGAVGNFKISLSADKNDVKLDEPLTLKVIVTGAGNFQLFDAPKIQLNSAFEQFEPKVNDDIKVSEAGISGTKTFSTVVIARQPGSYTVPAVKFSFFDPQSKTYKTIESQELTIEVSGERDSSIHSLTSIERTDIENLGSDIRFIKQDGIKLKHANKHFFNSLAFWMLIALIIIISVGILMFRLQQIKNNANIVGLKNRKAGKTSRKRLKKAAEFAKNNQKDLFYVEILNALWGYLSDKLSIPVSELNRENVQEKLAKKNIDEDVTKQIINVLDTCEFEHYAPESMSHKLDEIYTMAADAIEAMEVSIKA